MKHIDAAPHTRGESLYTDDVHPPENLLHAVAFTSPVAKGQITGLQLEEARSCEGVRAVLTIDDVPGVKKFGPIIQDETLFADGRVEFVGQPIALVVADTRALAVKARDAIQVEIVEETPVLNPREAYANNDLIGEPRTFEMGHIDDAWAECEHVVEGQCDIAGQEHLPLETNRSRAMLKEHGHVLIWSSTQSPYAVQKSAALLLGVPENQIEVDVKRLGGGFGGKEDQATHWACMAALAAKATGLPVEIVLSRGEDIQFTGKRHPYLSDYKIGLDGSGKIIAFEAVHYQNSGAYADLSIPVLERTLLHSTNSYFIPHVRVKAVCCRTNLTPHTAFRGFGGPQGMFVIEAAIAHAARELNQPTEFVQERNLLKEGDLFYYRQQVEKCKMEETWHQAMDAFDFEAAKERIASFNASNLLKKKGYSVMPVCFGISFTKTFLNQAGALVHIYTDGSVSLTSGGIEMGQGLNSNLTQIASRCLGIRPERVKIEATNTTRIANMSPSAASATTDLNGNATILAIGEIRKGLVRAAAKHLNADEKQISIRDEIVYVDEAPSDLDWQALVKQTYFSRTRLSAYGYFATPKLDFDSLKGGGVAFAYHVYGTAITEVTVDCLRGNYTIDSVQIMHDLGRPLNEIVDLGQVEGGLMQGLGWMTLEDLQWNEKGRYTSNTLSTYKAPDVYFAPDKLEVKFLEFWDNEPGPLGAKAVGEPPFMYGIGAWFALQKAIEAFNPDAPRDFVTPMSPERVLTRLCSTSKKPT